MGGSDARLPIVMIGNYTQAIICASVELTLKEAWQI